MTTKAAAKISAGLHEALRVVTLVHAVYDATEVEMTDILIGFEAGRADAFLEAAKMLKMSQATILLHAGQMTASEMRAVKAVLKWQAAEMRNKANER